MSNARLLRALRPRSEYHITRFFLLRGLGFIYLVAFVSLFLQVIPLFGRKGVLPVGVFLDAVRMTEESPLLRLPTLFWISSTDEVLRICCALGVVLSLLVLLGFANRLILLVLFALYVSFVHVGQIFYGYGWEILLLETGFLSVFLVPWLRAEPFAGPGPHPLIIVLFRWLLFRLMFGAGLIKLRGDACWTDLSCLCYHYETQPNPHPLSWLWHQAPLWFHQLGVLFNHLVELVVPFFVFGPRRARLFAGVLVIAFQAMLIASGNLSFLNWLTIVIAVACFDDRFLVRAARWLQAGCSSLRAGARSSLSNPPWRVPLRGRLVRARLTLRKRIERARRTPLPRSEQVLAVVWALVVCMLSLNPITNMLGQAQKMNASFDPLHFVNTYGAFGTIGKERYEVILEGTKGDIFDESGWREYSFPCKPGVPDRAPCLVTPYHYRIQWQFWFASFGDPNNQPWLPHLVLLLLRGEPSVLPLLEHNPFPDRPPRAIRARLFRYRFTTFGQEGWWVREPAGQWMRPMTRDDEELLAFVRARGWK